ncbi:MAG: RluA family pseudouridine synthase [Tenericutes bacterium]|nr:RluA family pseudouridine synthase [Mycoplasmatota bacterium]
MELIYRVKKPETIGRFIQENNIPNKILELVNDKPKIEVNEKAKTKKSTVRKGDKIHFFIKDEERDPRVKSEDVKLDVVYEDPYMLIVNKPKNVQMMISKAHPEGTLANAINHYYELNDINSKIHYVTKLDREASGLIVVAKHKFIKYLLNNVNTIKYYMKIIVKGTLELKESSIPLPIARVEGSILREVSEKGEECLTTYKVLDEFNGYSLVEVSIENKLAHQVRVHFSYFFAPIVGDKLYGEATKEELMMFCNKLDFQNPITEENIHLELIEPKHFKEFLANN